MKLLKCPFCGNIPESDDEDCIYPINRERTVWNLVCPDTVGGCGASVLGDNREECIKNWNTRA
jgi:hypothetical protein